MEGQSGARSGAEDDGGGTLPLSGGEPGKRAEETNAVTYDERSSEQDDIDDADDDDEDDDDSELSSLNEEELAELEQANYDGAITMRDLTKVAITPHGRSEKHNGRPTRRTAAAASTAWSKLTPRGSQRRMEIQEPNTPSSSRRRRGRGKYDDDDDSEDEIATPTKPRASVKRPSKRDDDNKLSSPRKMTIGSTSKASEHETLTPRAKRLKQINGKTGRDEEEDDIHDENLDMLNSSMLQPTSSDAYFVSHAPSTRSSKKTSDNLTGQFMSDLTTRSVLKLGARITKRVEESLDDSRSHENHFPSTLHLHRFEQYFEHWWSLLRSLNRPLLFYGAGSKRALLQRFAQEMAQVGRCSAIVVRGDSGGRIESIVEQMERLCLISPNIDVKRTQRMKSSTFLEARVCHLLSIVKGIGSRAIADEAGTSIPPAFLILIHNIDSPSLLQEKSLYLLGLLSQSPLVHICADSVHLNVAMMMSAESTSRSRERLDWLWIDLTTYVPLYDEVMSERGPGLCRVLGLPALLDIRRAGTEGDTTSSAIDVGSSMATSSKHGVNGQRTGEGVSMLTHRAAIHILRSVTYKARGLFLLFGARVLASPPTSSSSSLPYSSLETLARSNFLAMTPDALRSLLVEFTSHGLVNHDADGQVSIALSQPDLQKVIHSFESGRGEE